MFDDDPDYPLLASLENNYKSGLGKAAAKKMGVKPVKSSAEKSAIFTRRVVAARAAVRKVSTAADALAVSMAERGKLDAGYIGELLGIEPDAVLKELSSGENPQLFMDPATNEYVLRDAYLSGNVRAKLAQAKEAGMFENARALEAVQPEDVGAHEIVARVGSPWVPESIYEAFARELFGEATEARIRYIKLNSSFQVSIDKANSVSLANTWGTAKMPADSILAALLNNKPVKVTYIDADKKLRTDIEATEAANIKAQDIKDRFGDWLFKDADRAEMLVRAYNDTNNNYVTRVYDGSMMTFPGKVPDEIIKFRRHQRNAIARTVQDRTALFDHVVGAGKTFTVVAAAMELKRTGLAKKPMVAVPNHLVKQWAADFYRLYPGANILTATKKDFLRENRRKFLAKIATGDWDAVVIAHSSFGFIKPAPEFEAQFNEKQIADIVATIQQVEDGDGDKQQKKRTVKQLEGLKERLENRIKSLRDKPMDDLLDFQQIGVDQLFVDEFHMFKNLMFSTKMQNVQGLGDSAGSQRAYDMYVKINQIYAQNGRGQGFVAATGTPVSNSLAEMYHMMRYLMPDAMEATGFGSFDAWANTFASVEQVWMQKPSGDGFKASNRMSNFVNTPELLKMFDQVSDTVTQDDIKTAYREENDGAEFPLPVLKTGRRQPISLDKSEAQDAYMAEIAKRALILEQKKGPPKKGEDNTLVIMGDARKAAMDIRLVNPDITEREKGGRIDRAAQEIFSRYKQYDHVKGTQVVFSDLGTPLSRAKTEMKEYEELRARIDAATEDVQADAALGSDSAKAILEDAEDAQAELDAQGADWLSAVKSALRGFSVYDDLRQALVERGIPEAEVAFIHEYNTDDQKAALFQKVNAGQIRVLIGSTAKMGAGTNVQERLVAEHHLDVPWRPSDVEQREGRIIRQGNMLVPVAGKNAGIPGFEVEILAYVTKDTLDMRMWQIQETKLKMINQLRSRKVAREIDNAFEDMEMSAGEMQAAATGNVDLLKEIQLRTDVKKLEQRQRSFDAQASDLQSRRNRAERMAQTAPLEVKKWAPWAEAAQKWLDTRAEPRKIEVTIDGKKFTSDAEAGTELRRLLDAHQDKLDERKAGSEAAKAAAKAEFPGEDGESAGKRLEVVERFAKAHPMPKLAIEFNGETFGSKVAIAEAFTEFVGDGQRFDWEFDGKAYVHRQKAAAAMADRVMEALTSQTEQEIGTFGPFSVSVEGMTNKISGPRLDVIVRHEGKTISDDISASPTDPKTAALSAIERAGQLVASSRSRLMFAEQDVGRAEKALKELGEVKEQGEWPDRPKLEAARAAHKEVLARLSAKKAEPAAPADDAAQLDLAEDDFPDTIPMERGGFMDSRDEDAAAMAQETLRKHAPQSLGDVVIFALPRPEKPGPNASAIERERYASVDLVEKLFGKRVVFFGSNKVFGNGMNLRNLPDTIFINELSERPFMAVTGHEMTHSLRDSHPELYDRLAARIKELLNGKESDFYAHLRKRRLDANLPLLNAEQLEEELIANIVGDNWTDPVFWRHLAAGQPTLFVRVLSAIRAFFDDILAKLRNERPYGTAKYLKDVEAARATVVDIMRELAEGKTIQTTVPAYSEAAQLSDTTEPFYSALALGISGAQIKAANAQGWKDHLKGLLNKGAVKADEIEWTGINDWLDLQPAKVSKGEVMDYLRENGVKVTETTLGGGEAFPADWTVSQGDSGEWYVYDEASNEIAVGDTQAEAMANARDLDEEADQIAAGGTKYGQYTLPGGTNYREVLLTLPDGRKDAPEQAARMKVVARDDGNFDVVDKDGVVKSFRKWDEASAYAYDQQQAENIKRNLAWQKNQPATYKSGHWDQPNILAHIRLNDRTDADGKRVLFVEEIQSDWAQQGKKAGFTSTGDKAALQARADALKAQLDEMGRNQAEQPGEAVVYNEYREVLRKLSGEGIPAAPFVGKTDAWVTLAMKRVVKMAVDEGYDRVAFITGDQSVERYDLSKRIDSIEWLTIGKTTGKEIRSLRIKPIGSPEIRAGVRVSDGIVSSGPAEMQGKPLDEVVGKDIAKHILETEDDALRGLDLRMGGEGMKAFYDKIVPAVAKDVLKKLGGGKLGQVRISAKDNRFGLERDFDPATVRVQESLGAFTVMDARGSIRTFDSRKAAQDYIDNGAARTQPGFDITPAMREKAAGGLPMFDLVNGSNAPESPGFARRMAYAVHDLVDSPATFNWWHKILGTQFHKAEISPAFRRVFDSAQDYLHDTSAFANRAADLRRPCCPT